MKYPIVLIWCVMSAAVLGGCEGDDGTIDWKYTLRDDNGSSVLETERFTVVFEGMPSGASYEGVLRVGGAGDAQGQVTVGDKSLSHNYTGGVATLQYAGHTIKVSNQGRTLQVGDLTYQLEHADTRFVISPDGATRIEPG